MGARPVTLRIQSPNPLGEVTVVPAPLSGRSEVEMARAMAAALDDIDGSSAAEVYRQLRQAFPFAPLTVRVGALAALMDKIRRPAA